MKHPTRYQLPWQVFSYPALWKFQHHCARQAVIPITEMRKVSLMSHSQKPVAGAARGKGQYQAQVCLPL